MKILILSGVGGSTNWLPLIYPLIALIIIIYLTDFVIKYVKKKKVLRENELLNKRVDNEDILGQGEHNI